MGLYKGSLHSCGRFEGRFFCFGRVMRLCKIPPACVGAKRLGTRMNEGVLGVLGGGGFTKDPGQVRWGRVQGLFGCEEASKRFGACDLACFGCVKRLESLDCFQVSRSIS